MTKTTTNFERQQVTTEATPTTLKPSEPIKVRRMEVVALAAPVVEAVRGHAAAVRMVDPNGESFEFIVVGRDLTACQQGVQCMSNWPAGFVLSPEHVKEVVLMHVEQVVQEEL
jgi:hypothetical protein